MQSRYFSWLRHLWDAVASTLVITAMAAVSVSAARAQEDEDYYDYQSDDTDDEEAMVNEGTEDGYNRRQIQRQRPVTQTKRLCSTGGARKYG